MANCRYYYSLLSMLYRKYLHMCDITYTKPVTVMSIIFKGYDVFNSKSPNVS